jgi:hypothetical protein
MWYREGYFWVVVAVVVIGVLLILEASGEINLF